MLCDKCGGNSIPDPYYRCYHKVKKICSTYKCDRDNGLVALFGGGSLYFLCYFHFIGNLENAGLKIEWKENPNDIWLNQSEEAIP